MENEEKSFGELPTLGHTEEEKSARTPPSGPSWSAMGLSEAETLKTPEGIVDDGRTDGARRWEAGEIILDRYVVERELGQGGMGVVYECLDRVGGVKVAVKGLPPELGRDRVEMEEVRENFQLVVGLRHPNIAGVRTLEKDERGEYFLVMDVAEGEPLRRWMRRKARERGQGTGNRGMPLEEAIPILRQVASALDYAHRMRVIHRDVKPGNVMVDAKGEAKVLDFGLAEQIRTSMSRVSREAIRTSGTRPYMAPEQWEGQPQDARTDQYALGVTAYELLAGRLPFEGADTEVLRTAVLHGRVRDIEGVPPAPMAALRQALAKEPKDRFATCGEFVVALAGERTAQPTTTEQRKESGKNAVGGDVFLRKVRLGKELEASGTENTTPEEQTALAGIREVFAAGEEALRAGQNQVAGELFAQVEEGLATWRKWRGARLEKERKEAEKRQELLRTIEKRRRKAEEQQERLHRQEEQRRREKAEAQRQREEVEAERRREETQNWIRVPRTEVEWGRKKELSRRIQELEAQFLQAEQLNLTQNEQVSLADVRALFEDGYKAFRVGMDEEAGRLFTQTGEGFAKWWEARRGQERQEQATRQVPESETKVVEKTRQDATSSRTDYLVARLILYIFIGLIIYLTRGPAISDLVVEWKEKIADSQTERRVRKEKEETEQRLKVEQGEIANLNRQLRAKDSRKPGEREIILLPKGGTMEMVWCPPGAFMMGSPGPVGDEAQHRVTLTDGFWLARYEVTQTQWVSVMGNNPSAHKGTNLPVENVSWEDCREFCKRTGLRLPTEAQWEYACRADSTEPFAGTGEVDEMGWYKKNSELQTHPVGGKQPNAWGLYDMHGNVKEWCNDWYKNELGTQAITNASGPDSGELRVLRGGSVLTPSNSCRSAYRGRGKPDFPHMEFGFRPLALPGQIAEPLNSAR